MGYVVKSIDEGNHDLATALDLSGSFSLGPDPDIILPEERPWVSVSATASGDVDFYRFEVTQRGRVVIDIDGALQPGSGGFASELLLYAADGDVIGVNGPGPLDPGSASRLDGWLAKTLDVGVYYVRVSTWFSPADVPAGLTYELQISVLGPRLVPPTPLSLLVENGRVQEAHDVGARDLNGGITYSLDPSTPVPGTVEFDQAAGTFVFNPATGFTGTGSFNILVDDGDGHTAVRTVESEVVEALEGTAGADTLGGDDGDDRIYGLQGHDQLDGGSGDDILDGGTGNDRLVGGAGHDSASYGESRARVIVRLDRSGAQNTDGAGFDTLIGIESLRGSSFNDIFFGNDRNNRLYGNAGHDYLAGEGGTDVLFGDAGDDRLVGGAGADRMLGGLGDDHYFVDDAGDVVTERSDGGLDVIRASLDFVLPAEVETLILTGGARNGTGNDGQNRLVGGRGNDRLSGLAGDDRLNGQDGNDVLDGGDGFNRIYGGEGDDRIFGGGFLSGGEGADQLSGNGFLWGGSGDDILNGGAGWDVLHAGTGRDVLTGGGGSDGFAFGDLSSTRETADVITDFQVENFDRFDLREIDANSLLDGNQRFTYLQTRAFQGHAGELRYEHRDGDTWILGDVDGDKVADLFLLVEGEVELRPYRFEL